jgi:F1F0 ATPase subunit 2
MSAIFIGIVCGVALGVLFFQGLSLTIRLFVKDRHPALIVALSFAVRTALALGVFYVLARHGGIGAVFGGVVGFMTVKVAMITARRGKHPTGRDGRSGAVMVPGNETR